MLPKHAVLHEVRGLLGLLGPPTVPNLLVHPCNGAVWPGRPGRSGQRQHALSCRLLSHRSLFNTARAGHRRLQVWRFHLLRWLGGPDDALRGVLPARDQGSACGANSRQGGWACKHGCHLPASPQFKAASLWPKACWSWAQRQFGWACAHPCDVREGAVPSLLPSACAALAPSALARGAPPVAHRLGLQFAKHWFWGKWMGPAAQEVRRPTVLCR